MSQFEFVSRLRRCLAGLPEEEIDRAVEYYEDYFADAGESEEDIIKKLGSPEELAENIRRELSEKQERDQGMFTERGFETQQDRENYQQMDKFTQLEKKENPFEKKQEAENDKEAKNSGQRTSGSYYSGQYQQGGQEKGQYHYDDKKERKKNRKFIATLLLIFGFIWLIILILIIFIYSIFSVGKSSKKHKNVSDTVAEVMEGLDDIDPLDAIEEEFSAFYDDEDENDSDSNTVSGQASVLPDQNIQELKIDIGAGKVVIQEGGEFSFQIKKNPNNAKIKSSVKHGVWEIEESTDWDFHFNIKDLKNIAKRIKKGIYILITVPEGFEADNIDIEVNAGKVIAGKLKSKKLELEVSAGTITIESLNVTEEMDTEIGMGTVNISDGNIHNLKLECDMGKANYGGILTGENKINCNMGSVDLNLYNDTSNYTFSARSNMGSIKIDGENYSGLSSNGTQGSGNTKIKMEVDMGTIKVETGLNS